MPNFKVVYEITQTCSFVIKAKDEQQARDYVARKATYELERDDEANVDISERHEVVAVEATNIEAVGDHVLSDD